MRTADINLHIAAMDGDVALVQRWLDDGLFVDKRDNMERTPLHQACWSGRLAVLRLLLGAYAAVDARDKDQCTPLHYAATTDQVIGCSYDMNNRLEE
jgi:ankyrin repeat domain-containing protein 1